MHRSTLVSYCYLGRTPSASTVQLLTGGERADVREVEVLERLKAASGPRYGLGTCQGRGRRAALRGRFCRPSAGGTSGRRGTSSLRESYKEEPRLMEVAKVTLVSMEVTWVGRRAVECVRGHIVHDVCSQ